MKKSLKIIIKFLYVLFVIFLVYFFYSDNIRKNALLANVFTPTGSYDTNPQIFDDTESNFNPAGFYLKIPRIELFKSIIKDVDPLQPPSANGVYHGRFSAYPSQIGNVYLFSSSTGDEAKIRQSNAWFSKLDELKVDDFVYIYYRGAEYKYQIISQKTISGNATAIYSGISPVAKVTLQTNSPKDSNENRLVYEGILIDSKTLAGVTRDEVYSFATVSAQ